MESMLTNGPTIVLIYADWCGHCQRFKQAMWDECAKSPNNSVNAAAVHYDMVDKTSLKSANVEGYPTLFEVKEPTTPPRAIPTPQTKEDLTTLLNSTVPVKTNVAKTNVAKTNYSPEPVESLPPNVNLDSLPTELPPSQSQPLSQKGGSLWESLVKVVGESAHVVLLAGSASELSRRLQKRTTRKRKSSGRKTQRRR